MGRGIVSDKLPQLSALYDRKKELEAVLAAEFTRRVAATEDLRVINLKIEEHSKASKQVAQAKMAESISQIQKLINECQGLALDAGITFSLEDLGYMTEDEALSNGWQSSSC